MDIKFNAVEGLETMGVHDILVDGNHAGRMVMWRKMNKGVVEMEGWAVTVGVVGKTFTKNDCATKEEAMSFVRKMLQP